MYNDSTNTVICWPVHCMGQTVASGTLQKEAKIMFEDLMPKMLAPQSMCNCKMAATFVRVH